MMMEENLLEVPNDEYICNTMLRYNPSLAKVMLDNKDIMQIYRQVYLPSLVGVAELDFYEIAQDKQFKVISCKVMELPKYSEVFDNAKAVILMLQGGTNTCLDDFHGVRDAIKMHYLDDNVTYHYLFQILEEDNVEMKLKMIVFY